MAERLTLAYLIEALNDWHPDNLEVPVCPVIDSRNAGPGTVFFAFVGEHVDGHDYVEDAFSRGAVAAVVERDVSLEGTAHRLDLRGADLPDRLPGAPLLILVPSVLEALQRVASWWRRQVGVYIVSITGSVGKTTTKEIAAQVLETRYRVVRSQGSYNNEIGLPLTLLRLTAKDAYAVLEMGMYVRGDIRFLAGMAQPDVGVVTNVEVVHAERAGSIDDIALGKRELVEALPPDPQGTAILNADDARVLAMADHTRARVLTYGLTSEADLWADEIAVRGLEGIEATLHHGDTAVRVDSPLLGRHSIYAILRGAAVGLTAGLSWDEIAEGLRQPGSQLRLVAVPGQAGSLILDDTYNSSPPSALAALTLLEDLEGRKVAVLGDMLELGTYEREGHLEVGCRAAEVVSELVVVGPLGVLLAEGAAGCGLTPDHIHSAVDSARAAEITKSLVRRGDVVLVKGSRGVRMEQIVAALRAE